MVFGSLLFIADKMGDLSLQEPELWEITGSDTDCLAPMSVLVGLACEAQLKHESIRSGESELGPSRDHVNHHMVCCPDIADLIYKPSSESDSNGGQEVFMVGQGERPTNQIEEEIDRAAEAEVT
jgi:hypothetical protein